MTTSTISPGNNRIKRILTKAAAVAFWVAVWQLLYLFVGEDLLVASPWGTAGTLARMAGEAGFWLAVLWSGLRVVAGFAAALALGAVLAVATSRSRLLDALLAPLLGVVRATPIASFILLALIWISAGRVPVFIAFLMVVPMVWQNLYGGIRDTDPQLLEMARVFRFSRRKKAALVYLPQVLPHFVTACSVGIGFAWKSAIAAEVLSRPARSIGKGMYNAKINLQTAEVFAWTVAIILMSLLIEKLAVWGVRRLAAWAARASGRAWLWK